jgi:hypothetical protein
MRLNLLILILLAAPAARAGSVADLVAAVRAGIAAKRADSEIAAFAAAATLTERLEDAAIEQLESEGAGPRTVEELERLRDESARLPAPAAFALFDPPPQPDSAGQARLVERARDYANRYTASLPDFVCAETIRRYDKKNGAAAWKPRDVLTVDVVFNGKQDSYTLRAIDGKPTRKTFAQASGFRSTGEFGTLLRIVFKPQSRFLWERWGNLRGRLAHVFSFRIAAPHSEYDMDFRSILRRHRATAAMRGLVYLDAESGRILRLRYEPEEIPSGWPVLGAPAVLDYGYAEVAGGMYLLPKRVDMRVIGRSGQNRNVMEFGDYRKFTSDATVTFQKQ